MKYENFVFFVNLIYLLILSPCQLKHTEYHLADSVKNQL